MYKIIEFEKMHTLTAENPRNLSAHQIINIYLVLYNAYVVTRDENKFGFNVNNFHDWDQLNQLYNHD